VLNDFKKFIGEEALFKPSEKVLLAVSGGADSVLMAELFFRAGFKFAIAHCNFSLRGKESDDDEVFVAALARKYKVVFYSERFDTGAYAVENKLSIQVAARDLRYKWFDKVAKKNKFAFVATAHHRSDVLETMLINFTRGTGISGLHGIMVKKDKIIRPMLFCTREAIEQYAKENQLGFRYDSSNSSDKYIRNKLRMRVIPTLKEINPGIENTAVFVSKNLHDVELIYNSKIEEERAKCISILKGRTRINIKKLLLLTSPRTYLYEFVREFGFNAKQVEQVLASLKGSESKTFFSGTHRLTREREQLVVSLTARQEEVSTELIIKKKTTKISKPLALSFEFKNRTKKFVVPSASDSVCIDAEKLIFPLTLRRWQHGDRFIPLGMQGQKKVSDLLTDSKVSLSEKENTWVLISAGKIVWVVGMRLDERFKLRERTKKIYFVKLKHKA